MADLRVRFIGDEGNRASFFNSIARGPKDFITAVQAANTELLRTRNNIAALPAREGTFLGVRGIKSEIDAINGVIRQIGELSLVTRTAIPNRPGAFADSFMDIARVEELQGSVPQIIAATEAFNKAITLEEQAINRAATVGPRLDAQIGLRRAALQTPRLSNAQAVLASARAQLAAVNQEQLRQGNIAASNPGVVRQRAEARLIQLAQQELALQNYITQAIREQGAARSAQNRIYARDLELQRLTAHKADLANRVASTQAARATAGLAQTAAIRGPVTELPANYKALLTNAPNLLRILEKAGLPGAGDPLALQKQTFNSPRYDLVRDVVRYSGSFDTGKGIIADWSAEVDRSGKVVTRFGGQLSGASQILKQISRDFQKVIEWTVATTVVFGALQYTISQLNNLKELDFALQKFAITAQQSPKEAAQSFGELAQISQRTATPLLEIIGAADDIALATQRAGQSTEAWQKQIFQLTESVGVFTNLTGIDTVQATDLLTATMKQLRLTAADIPAILSKITAVAGGQSQAISDITKGLSVMAEAGRVAGLSLDQQIATVQVLSQVTSKTPAEVATAFKNLVGSLGSPAALKGLAQFNIGVRDQAGNLRNILDIYGEISDKIKSGVIPAADVTGLIRAISGGPRRAPDAAALLAAIDQITAAQQKSEQATNEAALANARAIDTTKSKLVQLQSTIDTVTFEKFGGEFKTFISSFTALLTTVLNGFNQIPTGVVSAAIQVGLFFIAIKAGTKVLGFLVSFLRETAAGFLQAGSSAQIAAGQIAMFNKTNSTGLLGRTGNALKNGAGKLLGGAAIGGLLSAASGGGTNQIVGGVLQGIGFGLLAFPEPTGLTKLAAGIALLGGTLLQFSDDMSKTKVDDADKAIQVLDSFSKFKSASFDLDTLDRTQGTLADRIKQLNEEAAKNPEKMAELDAAQRDYTKGLLDSINATKQAADARQELIAVLSTGTDDERAAANELKLADRYGLTGQALDDLILKYQKIILLRANPDLVFPDLESIPSFNFNAPAAPARGSTEATANRSDVFKGMDKFKVDLTQLNENVKSLFDQTGKSVTANFEVTGENIGLISAALRKLKESGDPVAETLLQTFNAFVSQNDIISQTANNLAIYQSYLDALTFLDPTKAAELQRVKDIVQAFADTSAFRDPNAVGPFETPDIKTDALAFLEKTIKTQKVDYRELRALAEEYFSTLPAEAQAATTPIQYMTELFTRMGVDLALLGIEGPKAIEGITDAALDAGEALEGTIKSLETSISDRLVKARADLQAGNITQGEYDKSTADLKAYLSLVGSIGPKFEDSITKIAGFNETLELVQGEFADIIGLENAASLSSDEFIERVLSLADAYGLNGQQLNALAEKLVNFHDLVQELNKLRVRIPIAITFDLASVRAAIAALQRQLQHSVGGPSTVGSSQVTGALSALQDMLKLLAPLEDVTSSIKNTFYGGSGNQIGTIPGGGTTKNGLDISELDLPEEITKSINASTLIKQAIENARKLQSQIPGATKEGANDLVVLLDGLTKVMQVSGIKSEYLKRAIDELAEVERKRLEFETKADTIRRIRVHAGDFSAIANVPVNSTTGVSLGGANGPINVTLNLNGTVLTPAQLSQFADLVAAALKRQIAGG